LSVLDEATNTKKEEYRHHSTKGGMDNVEELVYEEENIDSKNNIVKEYVKPNSNARTPTNNTRTPNNNTRTPNNNTRTPVKSSEEEDDNNNEEEEEEEEDSNDVIASKEVITINVGNGNNSNVNLAEMFKKRKTGLIEKLEKRKQEKDMKVPESKEKKVKVPKKKSKKVPMKKEESKESTLAHSTIKEPCPDLLNRLSLGEKANMSRKEIKELNMRLVSNLPDVKKQENEEKKKQESVKRIENTKSYSQKTKG